jgi:hypothetical protein
MGRQRLRSPRGVVPWGIVIGFSPAASAAHENYDQRDDDKPQQNEGDAEARPGVVHRDDSGRDCDGFFHAPDFYPAPVFRPSRVAYRAGVTRDPQSVTLAGMSTERKSAAAPMVVVLLLLVTILGAYVGGYFGLMMGPADVTSIGGVVRIYRYRWIAYAFYPAGCLERLATGHGVQLVGGNGEMLHP